MAEGRTIRIKCPNLACGRILAVPARARGKLVRCRGCSTTISVPQPREAPRESGSEQPQNREPTV